MFGTRFSVLLLSHTTPYLIYSNSLLDYWVRNVVLFMSDTRFMLLNSPGSSLLYFSFQNVPIFHLVKGMDCKRFRISPELFYVKVCCYNRCSMELRIMCSRAFLKNVPCLYESICCSKSCIYISALMVPFQMCKLSNTNVPPYIQRCRLLN